MGIDYLTSDYDQLMRGLSSLAQTFVEYEDIADREQRTGTEHTRDRTGPEVILQRLVGGEPTTAARHHRSSQIRQILTPEPIAL